VLQNISWFERRTMALFRSGTLPLASMRQAGTPGRQS
jgi:hypothetical protein